MDSHQKSPVLASLQFKGTKPYFAGLSVSMLGTWMQSVALAWLVKKTLNGSGSTLAVLGIAQFGPTLLLSAWAGSLADRFDKRRLLLMTQSAMGASALALAFLDFTERATLAAVLILSVVSGLASAFDTPARRSIIGDIVPKSALPNAMSLNTGVITSSRVLGMAVGGLVTDRFGTAWCFLANGFSFVAMIAAVFVMKQRSHASASSPGSGVRDAVRHVWQTPTLRTAMLATTVVGTITFNYQLTYPLLIDDVFKRGAGALGVLFAVTSVGSFAGAIISARRVVPSLRLFLVSCVGMGACALGVAAAPNFALCNVACLPMGLCGGLLMAQLSGLLIAHSDATMRGRVLALQTVVFLGSTPVGGPIVGAIADLADARWAMASGGFAALGAGVLGSHAVRR
jgi:MFS family permease